MSLSFILCLNSETNKEIHICLLQWHAYGSMEDAIFFFFIQSKEVKIYIRPLISLCKSHSPGSQVIEKRKVKTELGSNFKFGAVNYERWEKSSEENYKAQHLPIVT